MTMAEISANLTFFTIFVPVVPALIVLAAAGLVIWSAWRFR